MLNADFRDMRACLALEGAEVMVVGAYALAAHGSVRALADLDIWVANTPDNARRVLIALGRFGAPLGAVRVEDLLATDQVMQIGVEPVRIDVLTGIDGVRFADAAARSMAVEIDGLRFAVLSKPDLLATKLASNRDKDLGNIAWLRAHLA